MIAYIKNCKQVFGSFQKYTNVQGQTFFNAALGCTKEGSNLQLKII
jgi:hypothetical protein